VLVGVLQELEVRVHIDRPPEVKVGLRPTGHDPAGRNVSVRPSPASPPR
jgi:hypothetical protein